MKRIVLESFRDETTGELGLGLLDMPRHEQTNAATDGALLAHDLIEHVNGAERIGTIDDELEALGGIWYVRGQHGELFRNRDFRSAYTIEQNIGSDIARMFADHIRGDQFVDYSPIRGRRTDADEALRAILDAGAAMRFDDFNSDEREGLADKWERYAAIAFKRMQIGYAKARRKWGHLGRYAANSVYFAIADAVDPCIKRIEHEGQRFVLLYNRKGDATCEELYEDDDYV